MKKDIVLVSLFTVLQIILVTIIKGFSYPLLLLFFMFLILTYISIEDWRTGLISLTLNVSTLVISSIYAFLVGNDIKVIGLNLLLFVLPFVLLEGIFQIFNKDKDRFLVGGGDMILFATMSMILNTFNMCTMLFFACLFSIIASKIIKKSLIHFAPFIQVGFLIAFLVGDWFYNFLLHLRL